MQQDQTNKQTKNHNMLKLVYENSLKIKRKKNGTQLNLCACLWKKNDDEEVEVEVIS